MMKILKKFDLTVTVMIAMLMLNVTASAEDINSSVFATGTKKLLNDGTKLMLVLAPIAGGLAIAFFAIRKMLCTDEMDHKKWDKLIKVTIVAVIIAETASAAISVITSYYAG